MQSGKIIDIFEVRSFGILCVNFILSQYIILQLWNFDQSRSNKNKIHLRACSHEPGTVNYPGASVTSRSHDDLLSRGKFIVI